MQKQEKDRVFADRVSTIQPVLIEIELHYMTLESWGINASISITFFSHSDTVQFTSAYLTTADTRDPLDS